MIVESMLLQYYAAQTKNETRLTMSEPSKPSTNEKEERTPASMVRIGLVTITVVLGAFALFSVFATFLAIDPGSIVGKMLTTYNDYRAATFSALGAAIKFLGKLLDEMPQWLMDVMILYFLGGSGMFWASRMTYVRDKRDHKANRAQFKSEILSRVTDLEGRTEDDADIKWGQVLLGIKYPPFAYLRFLWVSLKWPAPIARNFAQWRNSSATKEVRDNSKDIVLEFLKKVIATLLVAVMLILIGLASS